MKAIIFIPFLLSTMLAAAQITDYIKLSQDLLYAAKTGDSTTAFIEQLYAADAGELNRQLPDDARRKAFWLNIYNAFVQTALKNNPAQYKNRNSFYRKKFIPTAGRYLSLDQVEHGLLRRSRTKWSLGYVGKLFPSAFEKTFRVAHLDYRIHFALNCGAKSCPPIAFYDPAKIDRQLDMATRNYLKNEAELNADSSTVRLPAIMSWFRADFKGKKGMRRILQQHQVLSAAAGRTTIRFKKYNWALALQSYTDL